MLLCVYEEVMSELDICLIGFVKKCKYKISDRILAQAHDRRKSCCGLRGKVRDTGGRGGLGGACGERGSMM